jgi:hypothetical protein
MLVFIDLLLLNTMAPVLFVIIKVTAMVSEPSGAILDGHHVPCSTYILHQP